MYLKRSYLLRSLAGLLLLLALVAFLSGGEGAFAQGRRRARRAQATRPAEPSETEQQPGAKRGADREPMRLVNPVRDGDSAPEQIWSGISQVALRANDNPVIRIYMAQGGSTLVELPEKDRFFAIHPPPAEPQLVVLEDSPTKATDKFFVIRAGRDFVVPPAGSNNAAVPAATITVQMRSGMTFTIVAYPVRDLRLNAHRVVVMYDPVAVAAARRAAGLSSNLGYEEETQKPQVPTTVRFTDENRVQSPTPEDVRAREMRAFAVAAREELERFSSSVVGRDAKEFPGLGSFGREVSGLRVAACEVRKLSGNVRVAVVAVSNKRDRELRLAQGQPDLKIDIVDERGRVVNQQPVKAIYYETNSVGGAVPAKGTVIYAIVYELPGAISSQQVLRAVVSEERSVDRQASAEVARR